MNILFCDFIFQKGNAHVDGEIIKCMMNNHNVTILANKDRYPEYYLEANYVENKHYIREKGTIRIYFGILRNMILAARYANKNKPDVIFISVYETRSFALGRKFFKDRDKIIVLENANIDQLSNNSFRTFYDFYKNKIHHVVYEGYMKDYLTNTIGIQEELISVIPHPCYKSQICTNPITKYDCIAISGSNDEQIIEEFILFEKNNGILKSNGIKVLIKSKKFQYDDGFLIVKNEYFTNEEYERLYEGCKVVYAPFPSSYKYRMSGCFVDSFSHRKPVVSSPILLAEYYKKKYPEIMYTESKIDDVIHRIITLIHNQIDDKNFDSFLKNHSTDSLDNALCEMINRF